LLTQGDGIHEFGIPRFLHKFGVEKFDFSASDIVHVGDSMLLDNEFGSGVLYSKDLGGVLYFALVGGNVLD
jgi:hypothetical protein